MSLPLTLAVLLATVALAPQATRWCGRAAGWPLALAYLAATAVFAPAAAHVLTGGQVRWSVPWVPALGVEFALRADGLGVAFTAIALLIGAVVFAYSTRYLEPGRNTSFYLVMAAFTLSMVTLVLADDLVVLFVAWEFTSLASFLLIARSGRAGEAASMRTLLVTFVGGLTLLPAVGLVAARTGTTSVTEALAAPVWADDPGFTGLVAVLVLVAGFTKAAQFPFHAWLPDAMAAATPVSAYLHAAAVVKAGIFLLLRFSPAFHATPAWNAALLVVGLFTAALGAWFALQQHDLKKLMAYSTVSQLGLIVAAIGVGTPAALTAALLHTFAHSLFKSGLFMMVGVVDHATHTRDLRRLPRLAGALPGSFAVTALGCASMAGLPPLLGFVSKESLFAALLEAPGPAWTGGAALLAGAAASVLTFAYCAKVVLGAFVDGTGTAPIHPPGAALVAPAALPILAGLPLGLAPALLDGPVAAAATATRPAPEPALTPHLTVWHGLTPELIVTLVVFVVGGLAVARRRSLWPPLERAVFAPDGAAVIAFLDAGLRRAGVLLVRAVGVDHPSRHLAPILAAFAVVVFAGYAALEAGAGLPEAVPGLSRPIDVVLLALVLAGVVGVCRARSRLAATVSLSAVGIVVTAQLVALGAPDVALTQLLVESLTIVVIMLVLQRLPPTFGRATGARRVRTTLLSAGVGIAAGVAAWALTGRRSRSEVADYYLANTTPLTEGNNVVNVILVEFRALDTLGELTVLGMAGVAIVAIMSTVRARYLDPARNAPRTAQTCIPPDEEGRPTDGPDSVGLPGGPALRAPGTPAHRAITQAWGNAVAIQLMVRVVAPALVGLSALVFWRGHNAPGGGFIAALVGAAAVVLVYLSTSADRQIGPPRLPLWLIAGGVVLAILTGAWGLAAAGSFLAPLHGSAAGQHWSSSLIFDVGVYTAVLGLVMVAVNLLGVAEEATAGGEGTRERVDEAVEGELPGPLESVRGERLPRVGVGTTSLARDERPREPGR